MRRSRFLATLSAALLLPTVVALPAAAQAWPDKPIRLVVPWPARAGGCAPWP